MFKQYWRNYPWWLQLMLFVFMVFILISLSQVVAYVLIPRVTDVPLTDLATINAKSGVPVIKAAVIFQVITSVGLFLLPALLFANLAHPSPAQYLGLRKPGKPIQPLLAILAMVAATPVFLAIASLMHTIGLGAYADEVQQRNDEITKVFMNAAGQIGFLKILLVMAVLPAISEEVFFRGIFLRFAKKRSTNIVVPIAISAIAFSLSHGTPYSFLAIFFAGVALAFIYYITGSLWCSMLAHMCYNGFQLALDYFGKDSAVIRPIIDSNTVPVSFVLIGAAVSAGAFYLLWKNRTPLPPNWADDFTQEELSEKAV